MTQECLGNDQNTGVTGIERCEKKYLESFKEGLNAGLQIWALFYTQ